MTESSPAQQFLERTLDLGADMDAVLDTLTVHEQTALTYDWRGWWARPKQLIPQRSWRSHGLLAGRRFGKSRTNAEYVIEQAQANPGLIIGLIAQTDSDAERIQIKGEAGLIECSPPWFKPRYEASVLTWPNGSKAVIFTPHKPGNIRGDGVHLLWLVELQSWPTSTRQRALENALALCSLGEARVVWDATPKRRHPLISTLLREAEEEPDQHRVVRGTIQENRLGIAQAAIDDLVRKHSRRDQHGKIMLDSKGQPVLTQRGREELEGEFYDDDEGALWRSSWITRRTPDKIMETVVSIDPAISTERGCDETGIIVAGLDVQGCFVALGDHTKKHRWEEWGDLAITLYRRHKATCLIVERNRGGDAVAANVRARAIPRGIRVEVLEKSARNRPRSHDPRTIYVREVVARSTKWNRAEPVAGLYQAGYAYHDVNADLTELEHTLCTWEPGPGVQSPNSLDALTQAAHELIDLTGNASAPAQVQGSRDVQQAATRAARASTTGGVIGRTAIARTGWGGSRI